MSSLYVGIYWNNHHHLLHSTPDISGGIMWANLDLLFLLSLFPFAMGWIGENHSIPVPTATYGVVLLMAAVAYYVLQLVMIARNGPQSLLARAVGRDWKGKLSPVVYLVPIPLALVKPRSSAALYILVALWWLVPDRRIERVLRDSNQA